MIPVLQMGCGVFWTAAYLLIISVGRRDRIPVMPLAALCANLAWEIVFSFIHPHAAPQIDIDRVWFGLDLVILAQMLRYGPALVPRRQPVLFYSLTLLGLVIALFVILNMTSELGDWDARYSAFGMNFMMSVLFVSQLISRDSLAGQSIYIAIFKLLGTLLASLVFHQLAPKSVLLDTLYLSIFAFDLVYVALLIARFQAAQINPWRRA